MELYEAELGEVALFLRKIGADEIAHSGRSFFDHLIGVGRLLVQNGCERDVCIAGALHALYGTKSFRHALIRLDEHPEARPLVAELFGAEAERLVWLFCTINRPAGLDDGLTLDWRTGQAVPLTSEDLHRLRLIEGANLVDQHKRIELWSTIQATWEVTCAHAPIAIDEDIC
jgi:hypothetical protein